MKLLLIIPDDYGTIARVSYNLFLALKKYTDFDITIANLSDYQDSNSFNFGDAVYTFPKSKYSRIMATIKEVFFIRKLKRLYSFDISISTLLGCDIVNAVTKGEEETIGIFHAPLSQTKIVNKVLYIFYYLACLFYLKRLDRIIAISESVKQELKQITNKSIEVIYNIHDFVSMRKLSLEDIQDDDKIIIGEKPYILCLGDICYVKGTDRLIEAFAKSGLSDMFNILFIGSDINYGLDEYKRMVNERKLANSVHFLGRRSNPYPYILNCAFLVSPSRSEGLPGVVIESLYFKKSVVATNSSQGISEIMECSDCYDLNQSQNRKTSFGIITPNMETDESLNVRCLAAALVSMSHDYADIHFHFNYQRFEDSNVVNKYIGRYKVSIR